MVLLHGHESEGAPGNVIDAFSQVVIGGICIGLFSHNLDAGHSFKQYVLLSIVDSLIAQIPSLLLSTAAAIIVTRVCDSSDISTETNTQFLVRNGTIRRNRWGAGYKLGL